MATYENKDVESGCTICNFHRMKLAKYLTENGISLTKFSVETGISMANLSRANTGKVVPRADILKKIADATGGKVTPNDFYSLGDAA